MRHFAAVPAHPTLQRLARLDCRAPAALRDDFEESLEPPTARGGVIRARLRRHPRTSAQRVAVALAAHQARRLENAIQSGCQRPMTDLTRRRFMTGLVAAAAPLPLFGSAAPTALPNVVLCMSDDQGWGDVGYNGHPVLRTPN